MFAKLSRYPIAIGVLLFFLAPAPAQDNRNLFKPPETADEFWRAVQFEIGIGKYNLAAEYLKAFIAKNPSDEELLAIEDREGASAFLRLLTIPELRNTAKPLVERVHAVLQNYLGDPKRLDRFIRNLNAGEDERAYAIAQLKRSGPLAMPQLIQALLRTMDDSGEHAAILTVLPLLSRDIAPPLLAALDVDNPVLRLELLDVIGRRRETSAVPYLWYLSSSPKQTAAVRARAKELLGNFLNVSPDRLISARAALTEEAERYYRHLVRFNNPQAVQVWLWDGKQLVSQQVSATQAEEYYGLRWARQALDLDPGYTPAQIVFLSLALDKAFTRNGLDQPLVTTAPAVKELLATVNPELVTAVLDRALADHRVGVALGATRELGDLAEVRAARPAGQGLPAMVRALNYPDRRVQLAAADALLRLPGPPVPLAQARVIDVLRRAIQGDAPARALIADANADRGQAVAAAVKQTGLEPVLVPTGREALKQLTQSSDIDVILADSSVPDPGLLQLLAQVRADVDSGRLPVIITVADDQLDKFHRLTERIPLVTVIPATTNVETLKGVLHTAIAQSAGAPLSAEERKNFAGEAMIWLARLGRKEVAGYDIRPAAAAILAALRSDALANAAIEAAGRLPGTAPQRELAALVLDGARPAPLRAKAAGELCRHIQEHGLVLTREQIQGMQALYATLDDPKLKPNVAHVLGNFRPNLRESGEKLRAYSPPLVAPPPAPAPAPAATEPKEK